MKNSKKIPCSIAVAIEMIEAEIFSGFNILFTLLPLEDFAINVIGKSKHTTGHPHESYPIKISLVIF